MPRPVLPPGPLPVGPGEGPNVERSDEIDPLWAATVAGAEPPPPGIAPPRRPVVPIADEPESSLARLARVEPAAVPAGDPAATMPPAAEDAPLDDLAATTAMGAIGGGSVDELAATTAIPTVDRVRGDEPQPTIAMPAARRGAGPNDTMVMPTVGATTDRPGVDARAAERAERRHRRRWLRRTVKAVVVLVLVAFVYVGINFALVLRTAHTDQARPVDVIVVLGAAQYDGRPSPQLRARLDHTIELWEQGLAPTVFVTGGNQPGDRFTEAEASKNYLVEHGVPADAIEMEDTAHSTWESFANLAGVADGHGWERVLIVTDPFHSLRSRLIAQDLGFTAYTSPTQTSPVQGGEEIAKELKEALGISVGRIIGFERLWKITG